MNVSLEAADNVSKFLNEFLVKQSLIRCDVLFGVTDPTYVNTSLQHESHIDHILTSSPEICSSFEVLDPAVNFSDHLPLMAVFEVNLSTVSENRVKQAVKPLRYRWDHSDLISYYEYTRCSLTPIQERLDNFLITIDTKTDLDCRLAIANYYNDIVDILIEGANAFVPLHRNNFWWNEELSALKADSVKSNNLWKTAGKPRSGQLFEERQKCRLRYRRALRENEHLETQSYTNDLHECLLRKQGANFWKSWRSKFEPFNKCQQVDGCVNDAAIAENFVRHFSKVYSCTNTERASELIHEYQSKRVSYIGDPLTGSKYFDVELVSNVISELQRNKAAGPDCLTAEHLQHSHPVLCTILYKLFNLMILCGYVPDDFGVSYTVPLPKITDCRTKAMTTDDFRGIAISCIIFKVFELGVLDRFQSYLFTSNNQFGFKKGLSCSHAIFTVRNLVEHFIKGGSTVNICALDLKKAFDKTNHQALFLKLMNRNLPLELLCVLENWFSKCWTYVKWGSSYSSFLKIDFGVRQGSVLSPYLFAVYIDDLVRRLSPGHGINVILYADDILLIAPSVCELQRLLIDCEAHLRWLDMDINTKKSCCIRVGPRCDVACSSILTINGSSIPWVTELRYLGIFIVKSRSFKCSIDNAKRSCYRSLNAIFGKIGRVASEAVTLELVAKKSLPVLLYGLEAVPLTKYDLKSIDFVLNRFCMKLFNTCNNELINECMHYFGLRRPSELLMAKRGKFRAKYTNSDNSLCKFCSKLAPSSL